MAMSGTVPVLPAGGLPETDLAAAVAIVEIVGAAVVLGVLAIKHERAKYLDKVHLKEIETVLKIEEDTLVKVGMEKFFTRATEKDPYIGLFLPAETLLLIARTPPLFNKDTDKAVRHVLNAIAYLVEYHQDRILKRGAKEDDVTSTVLSGIVTILGRECVKFNEITKVLELLDKVIEFTERFATPPGRDYASFRLVSLTQVVSELKQARFILITRNLSLSLHTRVNQLLTSSDHAAMLLLTNTVKLAVSRKYWPLLDTFIPQRLVEGRLRNRIRYQKHYSPGFFVEHDIELPKNLLTYWIIENAKDYLLALNLNDSPDDKGSFINPAKFKVPTDLRPYIKGLLAGFHQSESFLTVKVAKNDGRNAANPLVPIEKEDVPEVISFESRINLLEHCANIARYIGAQLRDSLEEYGVIRYKSCPHDMVFVFGQVKNFRDYISNLTQTLTQQMAAIEASQKNAMITPRLGSDIKKNITEMLVYVNSVTLVDLQSLYDWHEQSLQHHHGAKDVTSDIVLIKSGDKVLMTMHRLATAFGFPIHANVKLVADVAPRTDSLISDSIMKLGRSLRQIERLQHATQVPLDIQKYFDTHRALFLLFTHAANMNFEKNEERREKAHFVMQLLLTHINNFNNIVKMQPAERDVGWGEFASLIRQSADNLESAKHIDKRAPWTICFWKTKTRTLLDDLVLESEKLAGVRPAPS
jgi:hypothetical protein